MKEHERWWSKYVTSAKGQRKLSIDSFGVGLNVVKSRYEYLKLIDEISPKSILDAGCGVGLDYQMYRDNYPDIKYYGIDITKGFIQENTKRFPEAVFIVARIQDIPFGDASIDLVTSRSVLEHISDPEPAIKEMARVSRRYVALIWHKIPEEREQIFIAKSGYYQNTYSKERIMKCFKDSGLKYCYSTAIRGGKKKKHELWVLKKIGG